MSTKKELTLNTISGHPKDKEFEVVQGGTIIIGESNIGENGRIDMLASEHTCELDEEKGTAARREDGKIQPVNVEKMKEIRDERKSQGRNIDVKTTRNSEQERY